jgi:hypothetical protein
MRGKNQTAMAEREWNRRWLWSQRSKMKPTRFRSAVSVAFLIPHWRVHVSHQREVVLKYIAKKVSDWVEVPPLGPYI